MFRNVCVSVYLYCARKNNRVFSTYVYRKCTLPPPAKEARAMFFFICLRLFEQNGMEYILIYGRRIVGVVVGRLLRIYSTIIKYISKYAPCHRRALPPPPQQDSR